MKSIPIFFAVCLLFSCDRALKQTPKTFSMAMPNVSVEAYIQGLKENRPVFRHLPSFSPSDIPDLLAFANDKTPVYHAPANPISSYHGNGYPLGVIVLWTVENIRQHYPYLEKERSAYKYYPAQNPIIGTQDAGLEPGKISSRQKELARLYEEWWDAKVSFDELRKKDPLKEKAWVWK